LLAAAVMNWPASRNVSMSSQPNATGDVSTPISFRLMRESLESRFLRRLTSSST
jgi:hypothetical protein